MKPLHQGVTEQESSNQGIDSKENRTRLQVLSSLELSRSRARPCSVTNTKWYWHLYDPLHWKIVPMHKGHTQSSTRNNRNGFDLHDSILTKLMRFSYDGEIPYLAIHAQNMPLVSIPASPQWQFGWCGHVGMTCEVEKHFDSDIRSGSWWWKKYQTRSRMELVQPAYSGLQIRVRLFMEKLNPTAAAWLFHSNKSHRPYGVYRFTGCMLYTFYSFTVREYLRPSPSNSSPSLQKVERILSNEWTWNWEVYIVYNGIFFGF